MVRTRAEARLASRRARPPRAGSRYSRFVGLMKIVLPLIAAVLVAAIVVWPHFNQVREGFRIEVARFTLPSAGTQHMSRARFTGTDAKNRPYTVTAETAAQEENRPDTIRLDRPSADITLSDGAWVAASAEQGTLARGEQVLKLAGGVDLFHDQGFELHSPTATIDLRTGAAAGDDPVQGQGPSGSLNAEGFRLSEGGGRILFTGKARLVLLPQESGAPR